MFPCLLVGVIYNLVNSWLKFGQSCHRGHPALCIHFAEGTAGSFHLQKMGDIVNYDEERAAWLDDVIDGEFIGLGLWGKCPCSHQHRDMVIC